MDGHSLVAAAAGAEDYLAGRGVLVEKSERAQAKGGIGGSCEFAEIRTPEAKYVEHLRVPVERSDRCAEAVVAEHYDLGADPFELHNLSGSTEPVALDQRQDLERRLAELRGCAGLPGRRPPDSRPYCE